MKKYLKYHNGFISSLNLALFIVIVGLSLCIISKCHYGYLTYQNIKIINERNENEIKILYSIKNRINDSSGEGEEEISVFNKNYVIKYKDGKIYSIDIH